MSDKNIGKELTTDLILAKTKSNNLESIKNLNLWGNELEDLSILQKMPNLQVISLSSQRFQALLQASSIILVMKELYLRKNCISDLKEIKYIMKLPTLKVLWLHDNPCAQIENYRQIVIKHLPNLQKLDNNPVSPAEKGASQIIKINYSPFSEQEQKTQVKKERAQVSQPSKISPQYKEQKMEYRKQKQKGDEIGRNKNILMAVLSLMRELDVNSLEIVKRESQNLIHNLY